MYTFLGFNRIYVRAARLLSILVLSYAFVPVGAASIEKADAWVDFSEGANNDQSARILDYSYSGFEFSNEPIPDVSKWERVSVTKYRTQPNDDRFDDRAFKRALQVVSRKSEPVAIHFPAGRYLIGFPRFEEASIMIRRGNLVLLGDGDQEGGTEIFIYQHGGNEGNPRIEFSPRKTVNDTLCTVVQAVKRGEHSVTVSDSSAIEPGSFVQLYHESLSAYRANANGKTALRRWKVSREPVVLSSFHEVASVEGATVTFVNPVQCNLPVGEGTTELRVYRPIRNVGVQGIRFRSAWEDFPSDLPPNPDGKPQLGWRALLFSRVANAWVKDCTFESFNGCVEIRDSMAITLEDIAISGRPGSHTLEVKRSTGVLAQRLRIDTEFLVGPTQNDSSSSTVFSEVHLPAKSQLLPSGRFPFASLYEKVEGGSFIRLFGLDRWNPSHGPDLIVWNCELWQEGGEVAGPKMDFWNRDRYLVDPVFAGWYAKNSDIQQGFGNAELSSEMAYPVSLFDAQLQLRKKGFYLSSYDELNNSARHANDGNLETSWSIGAGAGENWLLFDVGKTRQITGVEVVSSAPFECRLATFSESEQSWRVVFEGSSIDLSREGAIDVSASSLRMEIISSLDSVGTETVQVKELNVVFEAAP